MKKTVYFFLFFLISNFLIAQKNDNIKKITDSAEQGYAVAQFNLGVRYFKVDKK